VTGEIEQMLQRKVHTIAQFQNVQSIEHSKAQNKLSLLITSPRSNHVVQFRIDFVKIVALRFWCAAAVVARLDVDGPPLIGRRQLTMTPAWSEVDKASKELQLSSDKHTIE
jgi:hypothetical protein